MEFSEEFSGDLRAIGEEEEKRKGFPPPRKRDGNFGGDFDNSQRSVPAGPKRIAFRKRAGTDLTKEGRG